MTPAAAPRAAIVGAGLMGRWHAEAAVRAGARVTAIVDLDRECAARLAARHPGSRVCEALASALDAGDVVHVCTPTDTHETLVRQALLAGRHVLVEKPLAEPSAIAVSLLDLADSRGVLLCPVHQFLFQDGVETARVQIDAIGPLQHVAMTVCSAGAGEVDGRSLDRIAREILPHPISLLVRLVPATWVDAEWSVRAPSPGEIRALSEAGGVTTSLVVSMRGRPTRNQIELIGAAGTCRVDLFHGFSVTFGGRVSRARKIGRPFAEAGRVAAAAAANLAKRAWRREPAYPGLRPLVDRFYRAVAGQGPPPISRAEVVDVARTCERLNDLLGGGLR